VLARAGAEEVVELIVRNRTTGMITAFAWWEGGGRVPLGELRAGEARAFLVERRSPRVALFVSVLADAGPRPGRETPRFIFVAAGERLEWNVFLGTSGVVDDYVRLPVL
jgi:hypothetical protein